VMLFKKLENDNDLVHKAIDRVVIDGKFVLPFLQND